MDEIRLYMALRIANAMSVYNSDRTPQRWHLLRKLFLLLLLMVALALGLVIVFRQKSNIPFLLFSISADASLGLAAGFGSRIVLRDRNWMIRGIASAAMSVIGLAVLGYFTEWRAGIGPLQFGRPEVDWLDLAHMVIGIDISWIALRAWHQPVGGVEHQPTGLLKRVSGRKRIRSSGAVSANAQPKIHLPGSSPTLQPRIKRRKPEPSLITKAVRPAMIKPARARRWNPLRRRPPDIQLSVYEEHRCPYCLEEVNRKDPRGVVECEVCHTLHHKDCWDITGSCQVPHLNT
ncbi:MAG: hypothetical protein HY022_10265 [Chloroflexi bacterium]|nr:hypothetical protein [Chloroflexota bacterium]